MIWILRTSSPSTVPGFFKKEEKAEDLRKNMKRNGNSEDNIKKALNKEVYQPCNNLREAIVQKKSPDGNLLDSKSLIILKSFYTCYEEGYTFEKNSIYYNVQVRPENHFKAFYKIATVFEEVKKKPFICYPLRTTFIPCYITVDTKILHTHILRRTTPYKADAKLDTWGAVVKLNHRAFKDQLKDKSSQFKGTMETDGVGVSLIKQNFDTDRKGPQSLKKRQNNSSTVTASIDELNQEYLEKIEGRCVLIDPGRRDLLCCMKETSTASDKQIVVHTKINGNKPQRYYRSLRQKTKPEAVQNAEAILSSAKSHSLKLENYVHYINTRATVNDVLQEYYGNETYNVGRNYYPDVHFIFWVKQSGDLYLGNTFTTRRREWRSGIDNANYSQMFPTYLNLLIQQQHIFNLFKKEERAEINGIVLRMMVTREIGGLIERASQIIRKLQLLPFRKMKFSGKIFHDQNDAQLLEKMKAKFGKDFIIIIGNWSAPNIKFQEPTRNKGFIEIFKKNGFETYLIDEFKTSSVCPVCESLLGNFKKIPNPRPFMRKKNPTVTCHGLLRYTIVSGYKLVSVNA